MTTDDVILTEENNTSSDPEKIGDVLMKLEELADRIRRGCVTLESMNNIEGFVTEVLELNPLTEDASPQSDTIFVTPLELLAFIGNLSPVDEGEDEDETEEDENQEGVNPDLLKYMFRGWYLTQMMQSLAASESDEE